MCVPVRLRCMCVPSDAIWQLLPVAFGVWHVAGLQHARLHTKLHDITVFIFYKLMSSAGLSLMARRATLQVLSALESLPLWCLQTLCSGKSLSAAMSEQSMSQTMLWDHELEESLPWLWPWTSVLQWGINWMLIFVPFPDILSLAACSVDQNELQSSQCNALV